MAVFELVMPKMGESIIEATILSWLKKEGDQIEVDDTILEVATDKVDSEVPSPVKGKLIKILHQPDDVVAIGSVLAHIETGDQTAVASSSSSLSSAEVKEDVSTQTQSEILDIPYVPVKRDLDVESNGGSEGRFYSPLIKSIAREEGISVKELDTIIGSGAEGRLIKQDVLDYLSTRSGTHQSTMDSQQPVSKSSPQSEKPTAVKSTSLSGNTEIIEMDRMRKMISDHMIKSKQTSAHVTSFIEIDVTNLVNWRNKNKDAFFEKFGQKITFTPLFVEALVKAIQDFPMINVSVEGSKIIVKKSINIGMAAALPSGNLIVPVIKEADTMNLIGLTKMVNSLAERARKNMLKPDEIQDGTFTMTNVGTFGNDMGTPIINQPQVAILAVGAIKKKPAVLETEFGDIIAVRQMMFLSLAYDHRVVDGYLGGSFLRRIGDYLEQFDPNTSF
ncbi:MAG TPA: dihydrolipoamide acetyltransferase family protein [Saprospiraceae bacterium]|nr:dihydrolipoamide acetyltransferase family protein [Saprospiraceae bacterium]